MYREFLYRPGGELAGRIDREFSLVARPGRVPETDPRRGDLLLEVELGRPGRGRCTTLDESAAETVTHGRRLPQGRLVLRPRVATTWRDTRPVEPEPEPEPASGTDQPPDAGDAEFIGTEHKSIGDIGSGGITSTIQYGNPPRPLTFGDIVSLAGDYFGTFEELRSLGDTAAGRAELAWTLWDCHGNAGPEPSVDQPTKERVRNRYLDLAANNISHFSGGGTAWATFSQWHGHALVDAFDAGRNGDQGLWERALAEEAFADHFLTDMFAGGHVRTPRVAIKQYYHGADSAPFVRYLADFLTSNLHLTWRARGVRLVDRSYIVNQIAGRVRNMGGHALGSINLGDIVSLGLHDRDNNGLSVVSELNENGQPTHNVPWIAVGDGHLEVNTGRTPTAAAYKTAAMAAAAVRASLAELQRVHGMAGSVGAQGPITEPRPDQILAMLGSTRLAAQAYTPSANPDPAVNPQLPDTDGSTASLQWRWGRLGAQAYDAIDQSHQDEYRGRGRRSRPFRKRHGRQRRR